MSSSENDVAWDLVDHVRATLTIAELNAVFVRLGAGEDRAAIGIMMKSLVRTAGPRLPARLRTSLGQMGYLDEEFASPYATASAAGTQTQ